MATRRKKILLGTLVVLFLVALSGLLYWGQRSLEPYLRQMADQALQTRWEFAELKLHPRNGQVTLRGVRVYHPDRKNEAIAQIEEIEVQLKSLGSLLKENRPIEIRLKNPKIVFTTNRSGEWELTDRIPLIRRGGGEDLLGPFDIETISIEDGEVEFRDGRKNTVIPLSGLRFKAEHWQLPTPLEPLPVKFEASFKIANSAPAKLRGQGDFLSAKTSFRGDLEVKGLSLPPYAPYYDHGLPARVVSGRAFFSTQVRCENDQLRIPVHAEVSGLQIELRKNKSMGFMADSIVEQMKNSRGNVEIDLMISGDIRKPQVAVLTNLEPSMGQGFKATGREIKEGSKSTWRKFKGLF